MNWNGGPPERGLPAKAVSHRCLALLVSSHRWRAGAESETRQVQDHGQATAHAPRGIPGDGHAHADTARVAITRAFQAVKRFEHRFMMFDSDAWPFVDHGNASNR